MIAGGFYLNQRAIDNAYNYAITLIQNGSYEGALSELEKANPNLLDRKEFKDDLKYHKLNEAYKNTVPLYAYALAQIEYNSESEYLAYMPAVNSFSALAFISPVSINSVIASSTGRNVPENTDLSICL